MNFVGRKQVMPPEIANTTFRNHHRAQNLSFLFSHLEKEPIATAASEQSKAGVVRSNRLIWRNERGSMSSTIGVCAAIGAVIGPLVPLVVYGNTSASWFGVVMGAMVGVLAGTLIAAAQQTIVEARENTKHETAKKNHAEATFQDWQKKFEKAKKEGSELPGPPPPRYRPPGSW
ncbi:MAG: hypothetical protein Q7T16_05695 [Candidatus Burarchaeum sp.]|nr:hypothetical protein [Candidatus Burarchaeum sp.]MDO8340119.1 hypothetical protein [Candidatus Burarchaeum sp.]